MAKATLTRTTHPSRRYNVAHAKVAITLRAKGASWAQVAKAVNGTVGYALYQYVVGTWPVAKRLPATTAGVQRGRNALGYSWAQLSAACGCTEAQARTLYGAGPAGARGLGANLGRGGRRPAQLAPAKRNPSRKAGPAGPGATAAKGAGTRKGAPAKAAAKAPAKVATRKARKAPGTAPATTTTAPATGTAAAK